MRTGLLNDAGAWTDTSWYDVPNAWSAIEIQYQAFANSGSLTLWLGDVQKQSFTFIDNDTRTLTDVRLGAQGIETGTRGTLYFDDFESRRFSYIGTLPDPGVNDPQATNQAGWFTRTYQYSASIPHAVTGVTPETGLPDTYTYDANGNMTCRVENGVTYSQTYNAENRIGSIAKRNGDCATGTLLETWSFAYDGDGTRVSTAHFTGVSGTPDSTTSYFMGGAYEVKDGAAKKYYSIAGMMVAVNDGTGLQYLLTDHLGSTVAVTNSSGTLTSQQRYLPFGAPRTIPNSPIAGTDFTYTGQRKLDDGMGGIMDYKARFYSPYINRFLQPDSIIPNPANPQAFNRFNYVYNRPINFNDPTGHDPWWCDRQSCIANWVNEQKKQANSRLGEKNVKSGNGSEFGLVFVGEGGDGDKPAFLLAVAQEANAAYDVYCSNQPTNDCGYATPAELYAATHGTTTITFSNSSTSKFCERNANFGQEGVICGSNSRGKIDLILAAHELGHVFNALIANNGQTTPYTDLTNERSNNPDFPALDVDISPGHFNNGGSTGEDYANMYSMWVLDDFLDTPGGGERRKFMNNNMYTWLLRLLNP